MHNEILCLLDFCRPRFSDYSYSTMEFNGLTSASDMSLPEAGYGSEEDQLGSEISGAVSGVTTPGASRLQASQLQERSATMQRLQMQRFMTHLLPGGRVPGVHRARSPVPPRLPHFASPRSVHHLAVVAAGDYQPRCSPYAWSIGVPAPPGPCYCLSPMGHPWAGAEAAWPRGWCVAPCATTALAGALPLSYVRPARGRFRRGWGRCRVLCLPRFPLPAPRFLRCVWRAVPSGCPSSSLAGTPFHAVCALGGLGPVALLVLPGVLCVCVPSRSRGVHPPPSPGWFGARTSRGPGAGHW